ncbi:hypothetical protein BX666DRAFT_2108991 [Dichotomocladium elegans]|nr:hypothetical protein BX666DRAFT_2108991 [Dichotomocladium elegans]
MPYIEVKWGSSRFKVDFADGEFEDTTVYSLKTKLQSITHLAIDKMKLLAYGVVMKDDQAPLTAYGIHSGSKMLLMGTKGSLPQARAMTNNNNADDDHNRAAVSAHKSNEDEILVRIRQVTTKLSGDIQPDIEQYEHRVKQFIMSPSPRDPKEQKKLVDYGNYLNEQLMRTLFAFDGILCDAELEQARQERKRGVQQCLILQEKVDDIKGTIKNI